MRKKNKVQGLSFQMRNNIKNLRIILHDFPLNKKREIIEW